jgi:nucleoside-diphosphate-sugar epimerase
MRALVTGATGYLGRALSLDLAEAHGPAAVAALVRDPLPEAEQEAAEELRAAGISLVPADLLALPVGDLPLAPFDVIYHLAAETDSAAPPERQRVNDRGTANLLETLGPERLRGRRVVLAGATAAIDRARRPRAPMREDDPPAPRTAYGRSKLEAERLLAAYAEAWEFAFTVPRFSPVWTPDLDTGFVKAFREQAENRSVLRLVGWPGRVTMVRREDAVSVLRHLGETGAGDGRAVNVADGNLYRYRDLMRDLRRRAGGGGMFLPVPGLLWAFVRWCAWLPVIRSRVPWRLSCLLGDDLAADTTRLEEIYDRPLLSW